MLALKSQHANNVVPLRLSVYISTRWYTGQEILKVKNHNTDITFTFTCDKGTVRLGPGGEWEHGYINGATAINTMNSIAIVEAWIGKRQLFANDTELVFERNTVSWGARGDQWVTSNSGRCIRLALGDPTALFIDA